MNALDSEAHCGGTEIGHGLSLTCLFSAVVIVCY